MNNESKHTPGPWKVAAPAHMCEVTTGVKDGASLLICRTWSPEHVASFVGFERDECLANARLIAAAPDLLAALEELDVYVRRWNKSGHILFSESGMVGKRISAIRATIARAKEAAKP